MKNFHQVDALLWRSARPEPADYAAVRDQFRSVVTLEGPEEDQKEAEALAPTLVFPHSISPWSIYTTGISREELDGILDTIVSAKGPVLVHCQHGEDRTGLVVAAYRVAVCRWTKATAITEALEYGYRAWLNVGLNRTWNEFARYEA